MKSNIQACLSRRLAVISRDLSIPTVKVKGASLTSRRLHHVPRCPPITANNVGPNPNHHISVTLQSAPADAEMGAVQFQNLQTQLQEDAHSLIHLHYLDAAPNNQVAL